MAREKVILFLFFLLLKGTGAFFLSEKPEEKARKYLKLSLSEYKKAILKRQNHIFMKGLKFQMTFYYIKYF